MQRSTCNEVTIHEVEPLDDLAIRKSSIENNSNDGVTMATENMGPMNGPFKGLHDECAEDDALATEEEQCQNILQDHTDTPLPNECLLHRQANIEKSTACQQNEKSVSGSYLPSLYQWHSFNNGTGRCQDGVGRPWHPLQ
ncbi:hypothetical protein SK128_009154 [Halocaridina rubra]|uniref:Uncharacterized protein n=1 Tax=Halocaridina rubra TaxID=373956 RepID=A0AAN8WPA7_HALRR